jgi:guanyl-specific ribonuclease Sa
LWLFWPRTVNSRHRAKHRLGERAGRGRWRRCCRACAQRCARLPAFLPPKRATPSRLSSAAGPYPHPQDGSVFQNRERHLPDMPRGYYHEYTVDTPGLDHRGARASSPAASHRRRGTTPTITMIRSGPSTSQEARNE